jgi:hypothetical protein
MDLVSSERCDQIMAYLVQKLVPYISQGVIADEFCARYPETPLPEEDVTWYKFNRITNWHDKLSELDMDYDECNNNPFLQDTLHIKHIYVQNVINAQQYVQIQSTKKRKTYEEDEDDFYDQEGKYDGFIKKWYRF